jgi:methyl-accepting chemotaxis protein
MKTVNDTLKILLLAAAIFVLAELGLFFRDMRSAAKETTATMAEAKAAVSELRDYSREQLARLRDPRNSKAIDAAIQTAAVFNGTGRLINTALIPRAMKTLDGLAESTASLNKLIQATDHSVNAEIAPEAVRSLQSSDAALKELSTALQEASGRANASLDDIHSILSDPAWSASLDSIQSTSENVSGITEELGKASQQIPEITKSINQIASTSSRYRRWILLSQIFSAVARAFF